MNPAELAKPIAEVLMLDGHLDEHTASRFEEEQLAVLERLASAFNFLNQPYGVRAGLTYASAKDEGDAIRMWQFNELEFSGNLLTYSTLKSRRMFGHGAVRALCLTFDDTLLSRELGYEDDVLVHVPAFSVESIERITA